MRGWIAGAVAVLGLAPAARAHELSCAKTVDGQAYEAISTYPATLHYELTVANVLPTQASTVESEEDQLLESLGFDFDPAPPFSLDVGGSQKYEFDVPVASYADCLALAAKDGGEEGDRFVDNTYTVGWDVSRATCEAEVECLPPAPPAESGPTRTLGFWKTHLSALEQCVDLGPVDLGIASVSDLDHALGVLWGSPATYGGGGRRTSLDRDRFLVARQLLGAICNERVFGTEPDPSTLVSDAQTALAGTNCQSLSTLEGALDDFNRSGDDVAFPSGFDPGAADPQAARQHAHDPTGPSGLTCAS